MFPILKIRLIYIKRNLIKNIFSFGYPILVIYLFTILLKYPEKLEFFPKSKSKKSIDPNQPERHLAKHFNIFNEGEIRFIKDGDIGIISNDDDLLNRFKIYSIEHLCMNYAEYDILNKMVEDMDKSLNKTKKKKKTITGLKSLNCKIKTFKTKEEFNKYLFSIEYKNASQLNVVFELYKKNDIIDINILSKDVNINSLDKIKSLLLLGNSAGQSEIFSPISNPSSDDNFYQKYYSIITNLKEYNNYNNNNKQTIKIKDNEKINLYFRPLNTPPIYNKLSNEFTLTFIPLIFSMSFFSFLFSFTLWMVNEKSQNLHEFLFRYGIKPNKYYGSWFITFIILTIFPIIICSFLLYYYVFANINIYLIFFSLMLFDVSLFTTSLLMYSLTKTIDQSQILLKIIYLFLTFLSSIIARPEVSYFMKKIFCFFPQYILIQNWQLLLLLDNFKKIDFEFWINPYNKISLLETFICYFVVIFIHLILSHVIISYQNFYNGCNNISDNKGFKNLINFIKTFFKFRNLIKCNFGYINMYEYDENDKNEIHIEMVNANKEKENDNDENYKSIDNNNLDDNYNDFRNNHEKLNEQQVQYLFYKKSLTINNISKSFGDVLAVNNFEANLFPSEIFCLLGHNGAGKSTLLKILSGIEKPDKGDIYLFGNSILKNKNILYNNIGMCNQENIFFDHLTVYEHLKYLSEIKHNSYFLSESSNSEIKYLINKLGLDEKNNSLANTLSYGQKRKLCLALALAGDSKIILLDEPTDGIDVSAKRDIWNFLKYYKHDKIIILTTHDLEEAEYLGDRIGIMIDGEFVCSGTGSFLKNKYQCGYTINFLIKNNYLNRMDLFNKLKEIDSSAVINISSKNLISINFMSMNDKNITSIFDIIENNNFKEKFGIMNYTISSTSLEDVFIKLNINEMKKNSFNITKYFDKNNELLENRLNTNNSPLNIFDHINVMIRESNIISNNNLLNDANLNGLNCIKKTKLCLNEFKEGLKKNFIDLWRNKYKFILEIITASSIIIIYLFGINSLYTTANWNNVPIMEVYDGLPLYFSTNFDINDKNKFFDIYNKDNIINKKYPFLKLKEIDYPTNLTSYTINNIADYFYNISKYKNERNFLVLKKNEKNEIEIFILYQSSSRDFFPASMSYILSILFQQKYGLKTYFVSEVNNILLGIKPDSLQTVGQLLFLFYSILNFLNSFISLTGSMINTPHKERRKSIKNLLKLSGGNSFLYWLSILIIDIFKYLIFFIAVFPILINYDRVYINFLIMLLPFLLAFNMFEYSFSFIIDNEIECQKLYILIVYILSYALPFYSIIKSTNGIKNYFMGEDFMYSICDLFPFSSFIIGMFRLFYNSSMQKMVILFKNKTLGFIIYNHCLLFLAQFIFYFFLLISFEKRIFERIFTCFYNLLCFRRIYSKQIETNNNELNNSINNNLYSKLNENSININIRENPSDINNNNININFTTKIKNLYKTYMVSCGNNIHAIKNLNLGLENNEHFCLLGYNGSGKSTTFKSITHEIFINKGNIEISGLNIGKSSDFSKLTKELGYCPKENTLFDYLTVEETLNFFNNLKKDENLTDMDDIYVKFGLNKYKNTLIINLSEGNKRKLNFAIALINNPKILLLDDPSRGIDPESRRFMWLNLLSLKHKFNMILSTNFIEDVEILSDKVGWMREGKITAEGISKELKIKFFSGYYFFIQFLPIKSLKLAEKGENNKLDLNYLKYKFKKIIKSDDEINILFGNFNENKIINNPNEHSYNKLNNEDNCLVLNFVNKIFEELRGKYKEIKVIDRNIDNNSFKFLVNIEENNQGSLFKTVLSIKNHIKEVSEININIESLENIFTKFL